MTPKNRAAVSVIFTFSALIGFGTLSCAAEAEQMRTITIPQSTTIVDTESSWCEPVYNENTGILYVPRCWRLKQGPAAPNMLERFISRSTRGVTSTFENQVQGGIDRQIYDMGQSISDFMGTNK